jgi:hypothetical protein
MEKEEGCDAGSVESRCLLWIPRARWVFSGFYPFRSKRLPQRLAAAHAQPLFGVGTTPGVFGVMLPYPHGFDDDPSLRYMHYDRYFLHIFNCGDARDNVQGVARCVKYATGLLPSMKRITFALETR